VFWRDLIINLAIYLIIALSLNLEYGYTGVPNFGKVLAVAGGAFAVGFFPGRIAASLFGIGYGLDYIQHNRGTIVPQVNLVLEGNPAIALALFFITLAIAGAVGAILGLVACYPAIRLREDYLAIILLVMGEAIGVIGLNYEPIIGGTLGVAVPDPFRWAGGVRYVVSLLFILGICLLVLFYLERLIRTPLGRMLRAIRDNEYVAESLGKDVTRVRMKTIMISSVIAAVGGALYAFNTANVFAPTYNRVTWTFLPWVMVVLGGAANNMGVLVGAFGFVTLKRFIDFYKEQLGPFIPFDVIWLYYLLLGVGIILIQMYRPGGLIPEKPTFTLGSKKIEKIVGSRTVSSSKKEDSASNS
jgi:branched-chain amino acid transport system permease protein